MDFVEIGIGAAMLIVPTALGFLAGRWQAFRAAAKASANTWDDKIVDTVEQLAQKIVDAKQEDPSTPLGQ